MISRNNENIKKKSKDNYKVIRHGKDTSYEIK